jgi:hypothetical protein
VAAVVAVGQAAWPELPERPIPAVVAAVEVLPAEAAERVDPAS